MPIDAQIYFYFVLPGFITVWTFRYLTKSTKSAEFEYLGLSVFWGLIILFLNSSCLRWYYVGDMEKVKSVLSNPFTIGLVDSMLVAPFFGLIGAVCKKWLGKIFDNFRRKYKI